MQARIAIFAFWLILFSSGSQNVLAQDEQPNSLANKIALVIGNSSYKHTSPLTNPKNDAVLIGKSLKRLGFRVQTVTDASQRQMKQAIRDYFRDLRESGSDTIGLIFYAGHGLQVQGNNYLIPVDAKIEDESDVNIEAVSASSLLQGMHSIGNKFNIVLFDACRNNPFRSKFRSPTRGLARMDAPEGSFIAFSTAPNDVAADGDGKNSPFSKALAEQLSKPGRTIETVIKRVGSKVKSATKGRQLPWFSSSVYTDFYITGRQTTAKRHSPEEKQVVMVKPPSVLPLTPVEIKKKQEYEAASIYERSLPDFGQFPFEFEKEIKRLSHGKLDIAMWGAGELVKFTEVERLVSVNQTISMGWTTPHALAFEDDAFAILGGSMPMGMSPTRFVAWYREGAALALLNEAYERQNLNLISIPCGLRGPEGQWWRKPLKGSSSLEGKWVRTAATRFTTAIYNHLGMHTEFAPIREIEKYDHEIIDYSAPTLDEKAQIWKLAKHYYYPSWQDPMLIFNLIVNPQVWKKMGQGTQMLIRNVCNAKLNASLIEFDSKARMAIKKMSEKHGVKVQKLPEDVLAAVKDAKKEILEDYKKDPFFAKVLESYQAFQ